MKALYIEFYIDKGTVHWIFVLIEAVGWEVWPFLSPYLKGRDCSGYFQGMVLGNRLERWPWDGWKWSGEGRAGAGEFYFLHLTRIALSSVILLIPHHKNSSQEKFLFLPALKVHPHLKNKNSDFSATSTENRTKQSLRAGIFPKLLIGMCLSADLICSRVNPGNRNEVPGVGDKLTLASCKAQSCSWRHQLKFPSVTKIETKFKKNKIKSHTQSGWNECSVQEKISEGFFSVIHSAPGLGFSTSLVTKVAPWGWYLNKMQVTDDSESSTVGLTVFVLWEMLR